MNIKQILADHALWAKGKGGQRADLSRANLSDADLSNANLRNANLSNANLRNANLSNANLPGFKNSEPKSFAEAILKTREWLANKHWLQGKWIETPDGAYTGTCLACLHGAAIYVGGRFGKALSKKLSESGFTESWNDADGRTLEDVLFALDSIAKKNK